MSVFKADCPHCGTRSVAFTITAERQAPSDTYAEWETFAICGYCDRGILANFESTISEGPTELLNKGEQEYLRDEGFLTDPEIYPSTTRDEAPSHVPRTSNVSTNKASITYRRIGTLREACFERHWKQP